MPHDRSSPVASEAMLTGTRTYQPITSSVRYAARTIVMSWLLMAAMDRAREAATAPIQPTEQVMCAVRASLRSLGFMITRARLHYVYVKS
ncbi:hypothetical protein AB0L53_47095 [Nonomuraea sp. NPDC052129]|uniref:hypothetical protein n=1 Tax=Nonomuraea sp. NPDC052129 TaxID=3154651 RepID=UPI00342F9C95